MSWKLIGETENLVNFDGGDVVLSERGCGNLQLVTNRTNCTPTMGIQVRRFRFLHDVPTEPTASITQSLAMCRPQIVSERGRQHLR
jgi:hypothetical protein